eukprot:TRINITY_DN32780_c0_g1_i1.p1 TRINITY_DN32780_c0_g1~~TRINITY_DN32780_c0_g1_i1.p1  ORF type:complete len:693 (+),score=73.04 TRINITY_DN32780_c0_g1_i1:46-2124(+)
MACRGSKPLYLRFATSLSFVFLLDGSVDSRPNGDVAVSRETRTTGSVDVHPLQSRALHGSGSWRGILGMRHLLSDYSLTQFKSDTSACSDEMLFRVSETELPRSDSKVTVSWKATKADYKVGVHDYVGVYSPTGAKHSEYLDFLNVSLLDEDLYCKPSSKRRECHFTFRLLNLRDNYELRYFSGEACLGRSLTIKFKDPLWEPTQVHLSLAAREFGDYAMWVTWTSGIEYHTDSNTVSGQPALEFCMQNAEGNGCAEDESKFALATKSSTHYDASDMCSAPANVTSPVLYRNVGYFHSVLLDSQATFPNAKAISYRVFQRVVNGTPRYSEWFSFQAPLKPNRDAVWNFLAYADHGAEYSTYDNAFPNFPDGWKEAGSHTDGAQIVNANLRNMLDSGVLGSPRLMLHFGDLSYAYSIGYIWELWQTQIQGTVATKMPYMVSIGNHEYDHTGDLSKDPSGLVRGFNPSWGNYGSDSSGECAVPVVHRFPNPPPTGNGIFWYSFDMTNVHIVQLSSEHDYTTGSQQLLWLEKDLKKVDRERTPWVIVTSHRPAYNSEDYQEDYNVSLKMSEFLDPILARYKVNLFLAGHYHMYERTCEVSNRTCHGAEPGPVHITVGSAGAWLDTANYMPKEWAVQHFQTFGFLNLQVNGAESLKLDFWGLPPKQKGTQNITLDVLDTYVLHPVGQTGKGGYNYV